MAKTDRRSLIIAIILVIATLVLILLSPGECENDDQYEVEIFLLENERDSLFQANSQLDFEIEDLKIQADSLIEKISNSNEIQRHEEKRAEEIHIIDGMDSDELYSFFANFETTGPGSKE